MSTLLESVVGINDNLGMKTRLATKYGVEATRERGMSYISPAQTEQKVVKRDLVAEDQADKQRRAQSLAMGASSTILTGGMGVTNAATVTRKKLFGE